MFQAFALSGEWSRAEDQLHAVRQLDATLGGWALVYESCIRAERHRAEVFSGARSPVSLGEPAAWFASLCEAIRAEARGDWAASAELRQRVADEAPALRGRCEVQRGKEAEPEFIEFDALRDADPRVDTVLELVVEGRYLWLPFSNVRSMRAQPLTGSESLLWAPYQLELTNGGEIFAFIPARYPGSEASDDDELRQCRGTDWTEPAPGVFHGVGQRLFSVVPRDSTTERYVPLLHIRELEFPHTEGA
jgi:type VI secretion system protein ImpE